jgi:hypothetical protein
MEEQQGSLDHIYLTIERRTTKRVPKWQVKEVRVVRCSNRLKNGSWNSGGFVDSGTQARTSFILQLGDEIFWALFVSSCRGLDFIWY